MISESSKFFTKYFVNGTEILIGMRSYARHAASPLGEVIVLRKK